MLHPVCKKFILLPLMALMCCSVHLVASVKWDGPVEVSESCSSQLQVASDAAGNAIAVWQRDPIAGAPFCHIRSSYYEASSMTWSVPVCLSEAESNATAVQITTNATGNATAIWQQEERGVFAVFAAHFDWATLSWSTPIKLSESDDNAKAPQVAMDQVGNVIATWESEGNCGDSTIFVSRFDVTALEWSAPCTLFTKSEVTGNELEDTESEMIEVEPEDTASEDTEVESGNNESLVLEIVPEDIELETVEVDFEDTDSVATEAEPEDTESIVIEVESEVIEVEPKDNMPEGIEDRELDEIEIALESEELEEFESASHPQIAMDSSGEGSQGNAIVVWEKTAGSHTCIQAAYYDCATKSWSSPVNLSAGDSIARSPQLAMNAEGRAFVIWLQGSSSDALCIQSSHFDRESHQWSAPVEVSGIGEIVSSFSAAIDLKGNMVAVWSVKEADKDVEVQSAYCEAGTLSWSSPVNLSEQGADAIDPKVAVDALGRAIAVWSSNHQIQAASFVAESMSWSAPMNLSEQPKSSILPHVIFGMESGAVVIWIELPEEEIDSECGGLIKSVTGTFLVNPEPPIELKGKTYTIRFPTQSVSLAILTWTASPSDDVVTYQILRDGDYVTSVSADEKLVFQDSHLKFGAEVTYTVVAVDVHGVLSEPVSVTLTASKPLKQYKRSKRKIRFSKSKRRWHKQSEAA